MDRKYGYVDWPTEYNRTERLLEQLEDAVQSVYNVFNWIWFDRRTQKVEVRIDRQDTWSMDHTLAHIILPMLRQLKDNKHGAPWVAVEDVPKELRPSKQEVLAYNKDGTTDDKFFERWDWVMDEMIFAFESKVDDSWEEQFESGESDIVWTPVDEHGNEVAKEDSKYVRMDRGPNDTKEYDWEGRKKYQERISNGFRLFGKYYENLWD
jgi:hypothetical protein